MIARTLTIMGILLWTPPAIGIVAHMVVDGYRGEASALIWSGFALMAAAAGLRWYQERRAKKAPVDLDFTIYDWMADEDGVIFYARREDGSEHTFSVMKGAQATRKAGADQ